MRRPGWAVTSRALASTLRAFLRRRLAAAGLCVLGMTGGAVEAGGEPPD
jgi:hypothetical protein